MTSRWSPGAAIIRTRSARSISSPSPKKTGKPLLEESWDGGVGVLAAKVKAGVPNWDAVQVEAEELALGCADGFYEKIDWDKLGGKDKFLPSGRERLRGRRHRLVDGAQLRRRRLKEAPTSWADFWDVNKFPGKRGFRRGPKYALEFALMADGVPPADVYKVLATPAGVDRAFKKLDQLKPHMVWWESGAQPLQLLASGEVVMTTAYNGRISGINKTEGKNFKVVWPGSIYAIDSWVILKDSPNKDQAMDFIAFASQPENQVKLPEYIAYGLPSKQAAAAVPADLAEDLPTAPANLSKARLPRRRILGRQYRGAEQALQRLAGPVGKPAAVQPKRGAGSAAPRNRLRPDVDIARDMQPFIQFESVSKTFGSVTVVDALDLTIEKGEFLSLLGPSGSGKTTILMMLAGFERPTQRRHQARRHAHRPAAALPAQHGRGLPELRPVSAHDGRRERRLSAGDARLPRAEIARQVERALDLVQLGTSEGSPAVAACRAGSSSASP